MKDTVNRYIRLLVLLVAVSLAVGVQAKDDKFVLVIDAGHGGKDPGALGSRLREKDINLAIALKFGALVQASHPDVKVVYTRKNDTFVELQERAAIANRAKADLFVSVHTNSAASKTAYGTETYTLGLARTEENLRVAKRENAVILLEDDFSTRYEGFDPNSTESYIMFEFMQDRHMEQSINLASFIQKQFTTHAKRTDRGVRQAGFLVLRNTGMPSVLIEVGYISNAAEETFLGSADGQQKMAYSIYNAFCEYKAEADRKAGRAITTVQPSQSAAPAKSSAPAQPSTPAKSADPAPSAGNPPAQAAQPARPADAGDGEIVYKVQFMTSQVKYRDGAPEFKGLKSVSCYQEGNLYKYTYGESTSKAALQQTVIEVRKLFKDAFVVSFRNGERIK